MYSVNLWDRGGRFRETVCANWPAVLVAYDSARMAYPDKAIRVFNLYRCDVEFDGLTNEERLALDERPEPVQPPAESP